MNMDEEMFIVCKYDESRKKKFCKHIGANCDNRFHKIFCRVFECPIDSEKIAENITRRWLTWGRIVQKPIKN